MIPFDAVAVEIRDYKEGDPIPPGFHLKKIKQGPLFVTGAIVFGASYGVSLISGIIVQATRDLPEDSTTDSASYIPMVIPVVGPFVTLATGDSAGAGTALLIALGTAQVAGVAMLIAGTVAPPIKLVRFESPRASFSILPSIGRSGVGLGIVGTM